MQYIIPTIIDRAYQLLFEFVLMVIVLTIRYPIIPLISMMIIVIYHWEQLRKMNRDYALVGKKWTWVSIIVVGFILYQILKIIIYINMYNFVAADAELASKTKIVLDDYLEQDIRREHYIEMNGRWWGLFFQIFLVTGIPIVITEKIWKRKQSKIEKKG